MKTQTTIVLAASLLTLGISAFAQMSTGKTMLPAADRQFAMKAAQGGLGEVALGHLASMKGSSPAVKQFGQRMVTDHSKANAKLAQAASQEGLSLPTAPGLEEQATMAKLSRLSGTAFDHAYASDMVQDHKQDIADFQKEASQGKDAKVKAFAAKTLPTLKMHLHMAEALPGSHSKS